MWLSGPVLNDAVGMRSSGKPRACWVLTRLIPVRSHLALSDSQIILQLTEIKDAGIPDLACTDKRYLSVVSH
jgi:hypothetical protein